MKPLVLVYTDDPMCSIDCADAVCDVLNQSGVYDTRMFGPDSFPLLPFNKENLFKADCIVFPGGMGDADQFDDNLYQSKQMIHEYINNGGKYLGICQGSYFAGKHYFGLLKGYDSVQYIKRKNSSTKRSGPTIVNVSWKGQKPAPIYFHDGAAFVSEKQNNEPAHVLARYENGDAAALIQDRVAVFGPHPEAQKWWFYSQRNVKDGWKNSIQHNMLLDTVKELFKCNPKSSLGQLLLF